MLDQLVGQFLQSAPGKDVLSQLTQKGLDAPQAQAALSATAEGAMQQAGGAEGLAGLLGGAGGGLAGLLGGSGGGVTGLAGMLGGASPAGGGGMTAAVAQFVAAKTGLSPAIAQTVVGIALPKLLELIQGGPAAGAAAAAPADGGIAGVLGGLLK